MVDVTSYPRRTDVITTRLTRSSLIILYVFLLSALAHSVSAADDKVSEKYLNLTKDCSSPFRVYVTGPDDAHRGILIVHGWLGLNKDIEALAEQFGKAGYKAMAIDLYDGQIATNTQHAKLLMSSIKQADANKKFAAALDALKAPGRKIATIGWSYGGSQALHATLSAPDLVSATVSYYPYGEMITDKETLAPMQGPMLIQVGNQDFSFTPEKIEKFKAALMSAGKVLIIDSYDARHSFDKPASMNYNKIAAEEANYSTNKFLDLYLN
jgi:carboxymethylenebutenolidase